MTLYEYYPPYHVLEAALDLEAANAPTMVTATSSSVIRYESIDFVLRALTPTKVLKTMRWRGLVCGLGLCLGKHVPHLNGPRCDLPLGIVSAFALPWPQEDRLAFETCHVLPGRKSAAASSEGSIVEPQEGTKVERHIGILLELRFVLFLVHLQGCGGGLAKSRF